MATSTYLQAIFTALVLVSCSGGGSQDAGESGDGDLVGDTLPPDPADADSPAPDMEVDGVDEHPADLPVDGEEEPELPAPLAVNAANPRYLDDGTGRALLLVGANHGWELQDNAWEIDYTLDYSAFLDYLEIYNLNFIRLWRAESAKQTSGDTGLTTPMPYVRTGPGNANDGQPRFDLTLFNDAYFDRLRARCMEARDRGIYVDVMLFERHSTYSASGDAYPWMGHPFHGSNNVSGIDADLDGDGQGFEYFLLPSEGGSAEVLALQEAYVRRVIDTVSDLENVIYEICNECQPESNGWQLHMIQVVRGHMDALSRRQLIGFTGPGRSSDGTWPDFEVQLSSPADFVSPRNNTVYRNNPPASDGRKVIFADSDHIDPYGRDAVWVWKSFLRGLHPQALEAYDAIPPDPPAIDPARDEGVRAAMGQCLDYADRMGLVDMAPMNALASSLYCLANPGVEYLVFVPDGGPVDVDLSGAGTLRVEWLEVETGAIHDGGTESGGGTRTLTPAFSGPAVLYLVE